MMTKTTSEKKAWYTTVALIPIFIAATCVFSTCTFSGKTSENANIVADRDTIKDESQIEDREVYSVVDEAPQFPEAMQFISDNLRYPSAAQEEGIQGRVVVQFVVNKDGAISDAEVIRSLHPSLDEEALRIINMMPKWTPGKHKGEVVAVRYTIPVSFRIE